jgi:hypothetical protein
MKLYGYSVDLHRLYYMPENFDLGLEMIENKATEKIRSIEFWQHLRRYELDIWEIKRKGEQIKWKWKGVIFFGVRFKVHGKKCGAIRYKGYDCRI